MASLGGSRPMDLLHEHAMGRSVANALEQLGWGRRVGRAPRGGLERKLQAVLE